MKYNFVPACLLLSLLFITGLQCIKHKVECTGDCDKIQVTGVAINRLTGNSITGVPFQLSWADNRITIDDLIGKYIYKSLSGSNGIISFTTTIDTSRFTNESLSVRMTDNDKFMMDNDNTASLFQREYSPTGFQNIVLGVYPQAKLVLHLQASPTTTNYVNLGVDYSYDNGRIFTAYYTDFPGKFTSRDITVPTAAGVLTRIGIRKAKADGTFEEYTADSIVCRQDAANEKAITL